jgi:hypothetical protein
MSKAPSIEEFEAEVVTFLDSVAPLAFPARIRPFVLLFSVLCQQEMRTPSCGCLRHRPTGPNYQRA